MEARYVCKNPAETQAYHTCAQGSKAASVSEERRRALLHLVEQTSVGGIVEGAQHARHILERRMLALTLAEGTRRLSLKVSNDEVVSCREHLPQVVIAMGADPQRGERPLRHRLHRSQHRPLQGQDLLGLPAHGCWQGREALG